MKKTLRGLIALLILAGCSSEKELNIQNEIADVNTPSTEVYVAGNKVTSYTEGQKPITRSGGLETYDNAYFFIRIDGRIPNKTGDQPSHKYYPQTSDGSTLCCELNNGSVLKNFGFKYLGLMGMTDYVYDPTGQVTQQALVNVPTLDDLLAAHQGTPIAHHFDNVDKSKIKFIWYVAKKRPNDWDPYKGAMGRWNVDGVLTMDTVDDVRDIPGMHIEEEDYMEPSSKDIEGTVKVDIHQQEHNDWEAIKTTIHIGALVDSVKISIPIGQDLMAAQDDFAIRTYDAYYPINYIEFNLKVDVAHEADQMVFTIKNIKPEVITAEKVNNQDGLTVEIYSYPRRALESEDPTVYRQMLYQKLQQAKVKVGLDQPNYSPDKDTPARDGEIYTQVSSAFF